jgi:hypothetical protein
VRDSSDLEGLIRTKNDLDLEGSSRIAEQGLRKDLNCIIVLYIVVLDCYKSLRHKVLSISIEYYRVSLI